ncbi:hypothetical protein [Oharaeibacter diazotrophicus]|uniref:Uncharacterized protein n=1 Tax=Oharaeibacter diazotrophicus TaxID=1920512 RepID=A0A4R6RPZ5_9HYPH|nr:hypothetical protein [Oharaeibacter diazotrophicus]TDP88714.1 hypothetical protein EDD54_0010 [Oharaeibacter diazotrophicus]BBE74935.1 hypothetical protein OHA_3_00023 [Pleomorphomonas sp. SM30]GLS79223.1 hypothetical protein GCM10007904_45610 [Oharaeibacter diazotrophicus]
MTDFAEYRFRIDTLSPDTIPMARLAAYLDQLAALLGSQEHVRLASIEAGSLVLVTRVDQEVKPVVSTRVRSAVAGTGDAVSISANRRLNEMVWEDHGQATLDMPGGVVISFPGRPKPTRSVGGIKQITAVQGRLVRIQGGGDSVSIGIEDQTGLAKSGITVTAEMAEELVKHFRRLVRLTGHGRWRRDTNGRWELEALEVSAFEPLVEEPLSEVLARAGRLLSPGQASEAFKAIKELREG